jgi:FlaA1/EpsC-like NDP-sugar epimerase
LRPGEKLHETLFHADELYRPTSHSKILEARARDASPEIIARALLLLQEGVAAYDNVELSRILRATIPEFSPADKVDGEGATIVQFPDREARKIR